MLVAALEKTSAHLQDCLDKTLLPSELPLIGAMKYAMAGGKRLRALLVLESASLFDFSPQQAVYSALAVEAMHAYSLVHDDLPCMDDDDLRRGQPTIHIKWDEATAVLAGDALQTFSFDLLSRAEASPDPKIRIELIATMARAAGASGMILGQAQDIAAETSPVPLSLDEITQLQSNKTGALIQWSAVAGAILAQEDTKALRQYATALGLAFQIADDVLDVEGDVLKTGKRLGKDADAGKATFVSLLGLDQAKKRAKSLVEEAQDVLEIYGERAECLRQTAGYVIARDK